MNKNGHDLETGEKGNWEKLVLVINIVGEISSYEDIMTFEYESLEKAEEDFKELAIRNKESRSFFFLNKEVYVEDIVNIPYKIPSEKNPNVLVKNVNHETVYIGPSFYTLEEWFKLNYIGKQKGKKTK